MVDSPLFPRPALNFISPYSLADAVDGVFERIRDERGLNRNIARAKIEIQRCNSSVGNASRGRNFFVGSRNLILNIRPRNAGRE